MNRLHSRLRMRNGAGWNPQMLFSNGEQGVIYDPSDLNSLFQDSAGTTPVTAAGQPVGRMLDKSGRGNHATQPTAASRPILRLNATTGAYYLETDGVDDWMQTNNIDFTGTDKVSTFVGIRKLSDADTGMIGELSVAVGGNAGTFYIAAPVATDRYQIASNGSIVVTAGVNNAAYNAPQSAVMSGYSSISGDSLVLRVNGAQIAQTTTNQGTGNYGNYPLYLFRRGGTSFPFNGHFYGLTIVGRLASAAEITNVERIYANKTGVTLA